LWWWKSDNSDRECPLGEIMVIKLSWNSYMESLLEIRGISAKTFSRGYLLMVYNLSQN
jgi:hypothetical protein